MASTPYSDDFVTLASWTNPSSNMAVSSGEVKASVDNATVGKLTRTHESVAPVAGGSVAVRVEFDFVIDTSMTAGTQVSVSLLDASTTIGNGIYVKQGVGIVSGLYFNTPGYSTSPVTLLAWANLVNGGRYHVVWTCNPGSFFGFYRLYDPSGNFVAGSTTFNNSVDWYNITRIVIESNSTKTTVSRFAIDPSLVGSATTAKYFTNTAKFTFFQQDTSPSDKSPVDLYIPGGANVNALAIPFHGSGQTLNFSEITTHGIFGPSTQGCLRAGMMVMVPAIPDGLGSGGTESWGNAFGQASVARAIAYARDILGYSQAPLHFIAYSMGTLTAAGLIASGQINVQSLCMIRSVCDLPFMEQSSGFAASIHAAWGVSHQANYAAAQVTFAPGDPLGLLNSNPAAFSDVANFMDYSTTGDATVSQANNCVAFEALLTAKGIAHRTSVKPYATHTENTTVGDAAAYLEQANSTGSVSIQLIAKAARDVTLNGILSDYNIDGSAGKTLQGVATADSAGDIREAINELPDQVANQNDIADIIATINTNLDTKVSEVSGGGGGSAASDLATEGVPQSRVFVLENVPGSGLICQETKTVIITAPPNTYSVDFYNDAAINQMIRTIDQIQVLTDNADTISFGDISDWQRDGGTEARFRPVFTAPGIYRLRVHATYNTGGPSTAGDITFKAVS